MSKQAALRRSRVARAKPDQVAMTLEQEIRTGKFAFGQRLQSENELVRRFHVSRTTVRKGLDALAGKGLITKRIGIGSFVTFDGEVIDDALGWTRALAGRNLAVETRVLRIALVSDRRLARQLGIGTTRFIAIDRTRHLGVHGPTISIERSRVPFRQQLEHLATEGLSGGSLSRTFKEAGLVADGGEEWADVECLNVTDAAVMGARQGSPCLRTRRLVRGADGGVLEYVISLLDPKFFALHLKF
jgi:GntR family transcriptional regulator